MSGDEGAGKVVGEMHLDGKGTAQVVKPQAEETAEQPKEEDMPRPKKDAPKLKKDGTPKRKPGRPPKAQKAAKSGAGDTKKKGRPARAGNPETALLDLISEKHLLEEKLTRIRAIIEE